MLQFYGISWRFLLVDRIASLRKIKLFNEIETFFKKFEQISCYLQLWCGIFFVLFDRLLQKFTKNDGLIIAAWRRSNMPVNKHLILEQFAIFRLELKSKVNDFKSSYLFMQIEHINTNLIVPMICTHWKSAWIIHYIRLHSVRSILISTNLYPEQIQGIDQHFEIFAVFSMDFFDLFVIDLKEITFNWLNSYLKWRKMNFDIRNVLIMKKANYFNKQRTHFGITVDSNPTYWLAISLSSNKELFRVILLFFSAY